MHDALEGRCGLHAGTRIFGDQAGKLFIDILGQRLAQLLDVDLAGGHHFDRVRVFSQCEQQVLKRGVLVRALAG